MLRGGRGRGMCRWVEGRVLGIVHVCFLSCGLRALMDLMGCARSCGASSRDHGVLHRAINPLPHEG
jgi:hypothetical protein